MKVITKNKQVHYGPAFQSTQKSYAPVYKQTKADNKNLNTKLTFYIIMFFVTLVALIFLYL